MQLPVASDGSWLIQLARPPAPEGTRGASAHATRWKQHARASDGARSGDQEGHGGCVVLQGPPSSMPLVQEPGQYPHMQGPEYRQAGLGPAGVWKCNITAHLGRGACVRHHTQRPHAQTACQAQGRRGDPRGRRGCNAQSGHATRSHRGDDMPTGGGRWAGEAGQDGFTNERPQIHPTRHPRLLHPSSDDRFTVPPFAISGRVSNMTTAAPVGQSPPDRLFRPADRSQASLIPGRSLSMIQALPYFNANSACR